MLNNMEWHVFMGKSVILISRKKILKFNFDILILNEPFIR